VRVGAAETGGDGDEDHDDVADPSGKGTSFFGCSREVSDGSMVSVAITSPEAVGKWEQESMTD
jgi:hypothetical protein